MSVTKRKPLTMTQRLLRANMRQLRALRGLTNEVSILRKYVLEMRNHYHTAQCVTADSPYEKYPRRSYETTAAQP